MKLVKQREKRDCVVAALATAKGITYAAAMKIVRRFRPTGDFRDTGVEDLLTRTLVGCEYGSVTWCRMTVDERGYGILPTWKEWLSEHSSGRYFVAIETLDGDGHCVGVVDGKCNDRYVCDHQNVRWYSQFAK
jgi:hypothetical protein